MSLHKEKEKTLEAKSLSIPFNPNLQLKLKSIFEIKRPVSFIATFSFLMRRPLKIKNPSI